MVESKSSISTYTLVQFGGLKLDLSTLPHLLIFNLLKIHVTPAGAGSVWIRPRPYDQTKNGRDPKFGKHTPHEPTQKRVFNK